MWEKIISGCGSGVMRGEECHVSLVLVFDQSATACSDFKIVKKTIFSLLH